MSTRLELIGANIVAGYYNSGSNGYPNCNEGSYLTYTSTLPDCGTYTLRQYCGSYNGCTDVVTSGKYSNGTRCTGLLVLFSLCVAHVQMGLCC